MKNAGVPSPYPRSERVQLVADPADAGASNYGSIRLSLMAGAAIAANDIGVLAADGMTYPAQSTDYAAATTANVMGANPTIAVTGASATTGSLNRPALYQDPVTGDLFISGVDEIYKFSATGAALANFTGTSSNGSCATAFIKRLSSGNLLWVYDDNSHVYAYILDTNLNVLFSLGSLSTTAYAGAFDIMPLSGGGFAYSYTTSGGVQKLAIFSNTGSVVSAAQTITTWTGTSGWVAPKMAQLSNGNFAIACASQYTTTLGLYFAIYSPTGTQVVGMTQAYAATSLVANAFPEIAEVANRFCIAVMDATSTFITAAVYDNGGSLQGSAYMSLAGSTAYPWTYRLIQDGTNFWLVYTGSGSAPKLNVAFLPTTGTAYVNYALGTYLGNTYATLDAFYERGYIAVFGGWVAVNGGGISVFNCTTRAQALDPTVGVNTGNGAFQMRSIPGGDFTAIMAWANSSGASPWVNLILSGYRYMPCAVLGSCTGAAAAGTAVAVQIGGGAYTANAIKGSANVSFDHTGGAGGVYGGKGSLIRAGALVLAGGI